MGDDDDEAALGEVRDRAKANGLGPFRVTKTPHFMGIGDAPDKYRQDALDICEAVARDGIEHFKSRGFPVAWPERKLVVVILASDDSYAKFLGGPREEIVGGEYDRRTNRLTTFDFRQARGPANPMATRANTVTLVHEVTHQWTFNSGLLDRKADVPVAICEGLAMYAEERPPTGRVVPGGVNKGRVEGLRVGLKGGAKWTPLEQLLTEDDLGAAGNDAAWHLTYAQDWLLVYHLMQKNMISAFQAYLERTKTRKDDSNRLEDAREKLGDLGKLNRELRDRARKLAGV